MKRTVLFLAAMMTVAMSWAQISKNEAKSLNAFLAQPSAEGTTNAAALGVGPNAAASIPGLKIENGHVTEIDLSHKKLAGDLNLSGFPALTKVNVSDNRIQTLTLANNPALVGVNASHNRLTEFAVSGCPQVQNIRELL